MEAILAFYAGFRRCSGFYKNSGVGSMNIFKRIRNWWQDRLFEVHWPDIQDQVDRINNEAQQERLKVLISEAKASKQKSSHLVAQLAALKTEALERGW